MIKKCIISRYDETIKEPPFLRIEIDRVDVLEPEIDYLGEEFAERLRLACALIGYSFKFYTMSDKEGIDYEVVVY